MIKYKVTLFLGLYAALEEIKILTASVQEEREKKAHGKFTHMPARIFNKYLSKCNRIKPNNFQNLFCQQNLKQDILMIKMLYHNKNNYCLDDKSSIMMLTSFLFY